MQTLAPTQGRTLAARPALDLGRSSGSAILARTMPTRSASPERRISSANASVVTRPTVATGTCTAVFTARDRWRKAASGAGVGGQ